MEMEGWTREGAEWQSITNTKGRVKVRGRGEGNPIVEKEKRRTQPEGKPTATMKEHEKGRSIPKGKELNRDVLIKIWEY